MSAPHNIDQYGNKFWHSNEGLLHRTDGPAVSWADGKENWYIHGRRLTEEEIALLTFVCYNRL